MAHIFKLEGKEHIAAVKPHTVVGKHPLTPVAVGHDLTYWTTINCLSRINKRSAVMILYPALVNSQIYGTVAQHPCVAVGQ